MSHPLERLDRLQAQIQTATVEAQAAGYNLPGLRDALARLLDAQASYNQAVADELRRVHARLGGADAA